MKSFEEIKNKIKIEKERLIIDAKSNLESLDINSIEYQGCEKLIASCQDAIANIDEVALIEVGNCTNAIISSIRKNYEQYIKEYAENFESFISKYILGRSQDGSIDHQVPISKQCSTLGLDVADFEVFKGQNPYSPEVEDLFKRYINSNFGTNIPLTGVEEEALNNYKNALSTGDELTHDKTFVQLKEIQRDAGSSKCGDVYDLLANNEEYCKAKTRISGKQY